MHRYLVHGVAQQVDVMNKLARLKYCDVGLSN